MAKPTHSHLRLPAAQKMPQAKQKALTKATQTETLTLKQKALTKVTQTETLTLRQKVPPTVSQTLPHPPKPQAKKMPYPQVPAVLTLPAPQPYSLPLRLYHFLHPPAPETPAKPMKTQAAPRKRKTLTVTS